MLPPSGTPGTDLPVRGVLPALDTALTAAGAAVLVAPPGTGKTTLVPLALAGRLPGRVLVAEPRRVAARAAARRMAALLGEPVGRSVGYSVRGDSRRSDATRVEVVTTGLLVRRLQADPELPGVSAVVLDECHERQLDTDLALAFTLDVRAALRPELELLAMSATAAADRLAELMGGAPVLEATGSLHEVEPVWCPPSPPVAPPHGTVVDPRLLAAVAGTVRRALAETTGDVLVFLPGAAEIGRVAGLLTGVDADVRPLHGRLPPDQQDAALTPGPRRRVVLSTDVAETSLTVPGVRTVVDAGLARVPRFDVARGMGALVTVRVSRASAVQRAGRAGREAPGRVYRLWSAAEHDRLPAAAEPEIALADLTGLALELAVWGAPDGAGLALPDAPPEAAFAVARATLRRLGAVDDDGRVTPRGRALTAVGAHPRLARALLDGAAQVGRRRAAEVVALLSGDVAPRSDDLVAEWRALRGQSGGPAARWRDEVARLTRAAPSAPDTGLPDDAAAGLLVGLAHPEWLARRRPGTERTYLLAAGTGAELAPGTALAGAGWLAVAAADRAPGRRDARVRAAVAVDEATALSAGAAAHTDGPEVTWRDGDVRAARVERLGAIVLAERPLPVPDPAAVTGALTEGLRRDGLTLLTWTPAARALRERLAAAHAGLGEPWPAVDDESLLAALAGGAALSGARSRRDLARVDLTAALRGLLPWQLAGRLDELVPERVQVPTGSNVRVDYADPTVPTLSVRVQEVFGWATAPVVAGRPLRLQLLSPASRVVATTADLAGFWVTGYPAVRSELRGRYPRHPWPEDPATAVPTRRAKPRGT
ncbi:MULTISPECIES: ATP-dependent helicase HrpB [unclassified Modestobacter]|uniref:ATP-dependent helicase HrpB n=1 Tax=unclassified Modestobacter TaxID=2643866 RepID=UPI0022AAC5BB|nr:MULTISPECIES: ATP-dependent helicase HrpB [unclassified Modestobacter]MCZ2825007.1 ATP-dependent helicase HrpB [Modestobacter sp. VKM Ac-2981]MCZ2854490.1 ATP-dependent helicase HrpB [Modestobacter sp. VKM Ac-2982]